MARRRRHGRRAGLADGAARVRLAGSRSFLLAPSLGHLRAASPTNVLGPLRSAPHARRRREGEGCRQPTANPLTLYRFRPSSPAAGGLSSGSRWCLHAKSYMHQQHRCSTSISSSSTTSTTSSNKAKAAAAAVTVAATAAAPASPPGPRQSGRYRGRKREAQALAPVRVLRRGRPIREEQEEGLRRLLLGRAGYAWPHTEEEEKKAKFEFAYQTAELVYDDKKQGYVLPAGIGRLDPKMQIRPDGHVRRRLRV